MMYDIIRMRKELKESMTVTTVKPVDLPFNLVIHNVCRGIHPLISDSYSRQTKTDKIR